MTSCTEAPWTIDRSTTLRAEGGATRIAEQLARWLGRGPEAVTGDGDARITLRLEGPPGDRDPAVDAPSKIEDEAYALDVTRGRATIRARHEAGLFWGAQTFAQLVGARRVGSDLPPGATFSVPCISIEDAPRFPFRAMHLDVARHFFTKETVERYIDLLAFYRFNVFHWHLTDDQGFRLEIKGHPELRDPAMYTQEDAREVVAYARFRGVTVIPEIEMPGHARAILASHPELSCTGAKLPVPRTWGVFDDVLCAGNDATYALVEDVLAETTSVFPSHVIHIGGDEVPHTRWSACPKCRALMKQKGVTPSGLEGLFLDRAADMLRRRGRRPMVWDEAFDGVHVKDAVVVAWQSKERGRDAARAGHDVVMAPHDTSYFNIRQSTVPTEPGHEGLLPWTAVRTGSPLPSKGETAHILGGEGALWSEYATTPDELEAMVMPRMAALAESLWSGAENSEADFVARFGAQLPMLDASNVRYFVEPPPVRPRSVFIETTTVTIQPPTLFPQGTVTTTLRSPEVHETTAFDVALRLPGGRTSATMHAEVVKETPRLATPLPRTRSGAAYTYQEGVSHTLADAAKLPTIARGDVPQISSAAVEKALAGKMRKEHFAIHFDAFVRVPRDAVYRFAARGDDGVRVTVDGAKVLEDDGEHAPRDVDGEIALAAGAHPIRVDWFQGTEGKELSVWLELPDGTRAPLDLVVAR